MLTAIFEFKFDDVDCIPVSTAADNRLVVVRLTFSTLGKTDILNQDINCGHTPKVAFRLIPQGPVDKFRISDFEIDSWSSTIAGVP